MGKWFLSANWRCPLFGESYIFELLWSREGYFKGSMLLRCWVLKFTTKMGILNTFIRIVRHISKRYKHLFIVYENFKNRLTKFCFESYVCGFHVYQTVWSPIIGEENLECKHEEKNEEDELAIGSYQNYFQKEFLVGHMPRNISKFLYKFLKLPNSKLSCKVKRKRLNRWRCWI